MNPFLKIDEDAIRKHSKTIEEQIEVMSTQFKDSYVITAIMAMAETKFKEIVLEEQA